MYSSVNAVGDVALLEYPTVCVVDEYFARHPDITPDNKEEIDKIFQLVLKELNIDYLREVIAWRIQEWIDGTATYQTLER